jgi:hypothetical protein
MRRGNTLVATLIVVVIIAILAVTLMTGGNVFGMKAGGSDRPDGKGKTLPGKLIAMTKDDVCMSNLKQIRMAVMMLHDQDPDEHWPATLQETKIGNDFYKCKLGGEPYEYNSETGEIKCVHLGHEKY